MLRPHLLPLTLIAFGCQGLAPGTAAHASPGAPRPAALPATAAGHSEGPTPSVTVAIDDRLPGPPEPLRDPRERRLIHLRQLTAGAPVAHPRFSADGQWVYFVERHESDLLLRRVGARKGAPENVPLATAGVIWELIDGRGGPCAVVAPAACPRQAWPEPLGLAGCQPLTVVPLSTETSCSWKEPAALPCVTGPRGEIACPVSKNNATVISLTLSNGGQPRTFGPPVGTSLMPTFSRDGSRLAFVAQPAEGLTQLELVRLEAPEAPLQPIGPEARRTLDPTFTSDGKHLVFASTADDANGAELDLLLAAGDGDPLERITFTPGADRFPAFSPDGHWLAWVSERNADRGSEDLFIAEWIGRE